MKNATAQVKRQTNSDAVGHQSQIDPEAMGIVMEILSKMYTNGPRAVLREYACNGLDSHVAAGVDRPVEVTLPNEVNPSLLIRDYGTGLSRDEIISVFGTYGRSTKRDTNDQVGAFGIGSKSAFVLVNSFIVTGYKDGQWIVRRNGNFETAFSTLQEADDYVSDLIHVEESTDQFEVTQGSVRTTVEFGLDENNVSTAWVRRETPTEEPNGVLITLTPPDTHVMRAEAESFFSTWETGSVLVDGEEPTSIYDQGTALSDSIHVVPNHTGQILVVMGNVAYPASRDLLRKVAKSLEDTAAHKQAESLVSWANSTTTSILFKVPIGAVDIAPTREGLRDTDTTVAALANLVESLVVKMTESVRAKVDAAPNVYQAALLLHHEVEALDAFKVRRRDFTYKGKPIHKDVETREVIVRVASEWRWGRRGGRQVEEVVTTERPAPQENDKHVIDHARAPQTVVVVVPSLDDVGKVKRYAKRFLTENEQGWKYILVTDKPKGSEGWFQWGHKDTATTLDLDGYRAILRSMRDSNPRTINEPSYTTGWGQSPSRDLEDRDLLTDILSWGKPLVISDGRGVRVPGFAADLKDQYTNVVLLGTQSEDALRKRVEKDGSVEIVEEQEVRDAIRAKAQALVDSITDDQRMTLAATSWLRANNYEIREWRDWQTALSKDDTEDEVYVNPVIQDVMDTVELVTMYRDASLDVDDLRDAANWLGRDLVAEAEQAGLLPEMPQRSDRLPVMLQYISDWEVRRNADLRAEVKRYLASA